MYHSRQFMSVPTHLPGNESVCAVVLCLMVEPLESLKHLPAGSGCGSTRGDEVRKYAGMERTERRG